MSGEGAGNRGGEVEPNAATIVSEEKFASFMSFRFDYDFSRGIEACALSQLGKTSHQC